jgi:PucR C-terminal helix-turn-helix domain/GGDEF-like domain
MPSGGGRAARAKGQDQDIFARLSERGEEFERSALARVHAIAEPAETSDPEYAQGLRQSISAALDYGLAALRHGSEDPPPLPPLLLSQARLAARNGVSLDTVLRRYFSGFALFGDFVIAEAEESSLPKGASVQELLAKEAAHFDRLIEAVSQEHTKERERRFRTPKERQTERVRALLAGEPIDTEKLGYELEAWHIAALGAGKDAEAAIRCLAETLDRRILLINPGEKTSWAWLGGQRRIPTEAILEKAKGSWPEKTAIAFGEPAKGPEGWRFSHRQAKAALPIAQRQGEAVRYADVGLLASAMQDEVLAKSLRRLYLEPLEAERDGGMVLRETLRAYFAAGQNVSSAAVGLGVHRDTVTARLRAVEERIGAKLATWATGLEVALRLEEMGAYELAGQSTNH